MLNIQFDKKGKARVYKPIPFMQRVAEFFGGVFFVWLGFSLTGSDPLWLGPAIFLCGVAVVFFAFRSRHEMT